MTKELKSHPHRLYNLYLANYKAHQARKELARVKAKWADQVPTDMIGELDNVITSIIVLDDIEKRIEVVEVNYV